MFDVLASLGSHHKLILIDLEELAEVADDRDVRLGETSNGALVGQLQDPVHLVRGKVGDNDTDLLLTLQLGHHGVQERAEPGQYYPVASSLGVVVDNKSHVRRTARKPGTYRVLGLEQDQR